MELWFVLSADFALFALNGSDHKWFMVLFNIQLWHKKAEKTDARQVSSLLI